MMQLRQRYEKAEKDKAITQEKLRELTKEHRRVCAQRDDHTAVAAALKEEHVRAIQALGTTSRRRRPQTPPAYQHLQRRNAPSSALATSDQTHKQTEI